MALLKAVQAAFERIAPLRLAGSWDNPGVLLNVSDATPSQNKTVLLCIDLTSEVLDTKPADTGVIVAYHPAIFGGLKSVSQSVPLQNNLIRCARDGISVFSPHSALDGCVGGINDWLASGLGRGRSRRLADKPGIKSGLRGEEGAGEGLIHELEEPVSVEEYVSRVKKHLGLETVMLARGRGPNARKSIKSVAICAGSGGSMLGSIECDAWLTGEASHHEYLAAVASGKHVLLCTHTGNERPYLPVLAKTLEQALSDLCRERDSGGKQHNLEDIPKVVVSQGCTNPLSFV